MHPPFDVHRVVFNKCNFRTQIKWRLVNRWFFKRLHIVDFRKMEPIDLEKLTDDIIVKHTSCKFLVVFGCQITDEGLQKLQPYYLNVGDNITNAGISHMNLHTLVNFCSSITDDGIQGMHLHTLIAPTTFTDEGIKHMQLHTLHASTKMTDVGIRHMQLDSLHAFHSSISDEGIRHMNLYTLDASDIMTDNGIKNMRLCELFANRLISNEGIRKQPLKVLYTNNSQVNEKGIGELQLHTLVVQPNLSHNINPANMNLHTAKITLGFGQHLWIIKNGQVVHT